MNASSLLLILRPVLLLWIGLLTLATRAAEAPRPANRADVERVLAAARAMRGEQMPERLLKIVLLADRKDHGPGAHDYPLWQSRWALLLGGAEASDAEAANMHGTDRPDPALQQGAPQVRVSTATAWPSETQWKTADLIVVFCYVAWTPERIAQVTRFLERGGGLVVIHAATWTKPKPSAEVASILGVGGFTRYRHGTVELETVQPEHPVCLGLPAKLRLTDETYWPPTPPVAPDRVQVLAGSREQTEPDQYGVSLQPMFWTYTLGTGRVFGCVLGHYSWTFDDPYFRLWLLRGMAWAANDNPYRFDDLALRSAAVAEE